MKLGGAGFSPVQAKIPGTTYFEDLENCLKLKIVQNITLQQLNILKNSPEPNSRWFTLHLLTTIQTVATIYIREQ